MGWFEKTHASVEAAEKRTLGEGVFRKCDGCGATQKSEDFVARFEVCPACGHHHRLSGGGWIDLLADEDTFEELDRGLLATDPLEFTDSKPYKDRLERSRKKTLLDDAIVVGECTLAGRPVQLGVFFFSFMGGSMGSVVGEKITRMLERGAQKKQPVILLSASGGARMQEGVLSLMQMAKTVAALGRLREAGAPFFSVLLHPTTGGVAASYALLGDINIAEPGALIGFAGPRVIENTIREKLPAGFQRSEFLLDHGMIDVIIERPKMKKSLAHLLSLLLD